jgi:hypothetical protein
MTNIADNVLAVQTTLATLPTVLATAVEAAVKEAIAGITLPAPDLTAVEALVTGVGVKVDTVLADLEPTPAAPVAPTA